MVVAFTIHLVVSFLIAVACMSSFLRKLLSSERVKTHLALMIGVLFAALLIVDVYIVQSFILAMNNRPKDVLIIGMDPIPESIAFIINWLVPCGCVAQIVNYFTSQGLQKKLLYVGAILFLLSAVGMVILGYYVFDIYLGGQSIRSAVWWF